MMKYKANKVRTYALAAGIIAVLMCCALLGGLWRTGSAYAAVADDWESVYGEITATEGEDGYTNLTGFTAQTNSSKLSGARYAYKIHLDGATITMRDENTTANLDTWGFALSGTSDGFVNEADSPLGAFFCKGKYSSNTQTRFNIGSGNFDSPSIVWATTDYTKGTYAANFGVASSLVLKNNGDYSQNYGLKVRFDYVIDADNEEGAYWKITVTELYKGQMWAGNNSANYNATDGSSTVYMRPSVLQGALDEHGNIYLLAAGSVQTGGTLQYKVEDKNGEEYADMREQYISEAESALTEYESMLGEEMNYVRWLSCRDAKNRAENAVMMLRGDDRAPFVARLDSCNSLFAVIDVPMPSDGEYVFVSGSGKTSYDPGDGYSRIGGLNAWGTRAYFAHKVHLDGLTVYMRDEGTTENDDFWGFALSSSNEGYFAEANTPLAAIFRKGLYGSGAQTRFNIGASHDFGAAVHVWPTKDYTLGNYSYNFGVATSLVLYNTVNYGLKVRFDYVTDSANEEGAYWKITVTGLYPGQLWSSTANYNAADGSSTVYMRPSVVRNILDSYGDVYLIAGGSVADGGILQYKVEDANLAEYRETTYAQVAEQVAAYGESAASATADNFEELLSERNELLETVASTLRANDATIQTMYVYAHDRKLTANEDIQDYIKNRLDASFGEAKTVTDGFTAESTITAANIQAASTKLAAAREDYDYYKSLLSRTNCDYFDELDSGIIYDIRYAQAKTWIIAYESAVNNLSALEGNALVNSILQVRDMRAGYESSEANRIINTYLTAADKASYAQRIAAADAAFDEIYTSVESEVKDKYLTIFETALEANLEVANNLSAARDAYVTLSANVEITSDDGEIYTRYTAAKAKFVSACEKYISGEMTFINSSLDGEKIVTLTEFASVKSAYRGINTVYIEYCGEEVKAKFSEMRERVESHNLYWFSMTSVDGASKFENTERGIYHEFYPNWGNRINYDKKLDLTKGVTLTLTFDEYASLLSKNSNNIFLNFLSRPGVNRGEADGVTLILWMSDSSGTSYCRVYGHSDSDVAYVAFRTPEEGETLKIKLTYGDYHDYDGSVYPAYMIDINDGEATLAVTRAQIEQGTHTAGTDVYLSISAACNNKTRVNGITLNSIAEGDDVKNFGEPIEQDPDDDNKPNEGDKPSDDEGKKDPAPAKDGLAGWAIALIVITCVLVAGGGAATAVILVRRKKGGK